MSIILQTLVSGWQTVIQRAQDRKKVLFGDQADDAMRFYAEADHGFMYSQAYMEQSLGLSLAEGGGGMPKPRFQATINLTSNAAQVFLPVLYNRNPTRTVKPKKYAYDDGAIMALHQQLGATADPMVQQQRDAFRQEREYQRMGRAALFQHYLNQTPRELNLKEEARKSVLEAFIKGMGILWAEAFPSTDGTRLVGLKHDSIDYFLIDPDCEDLRLGGFIVRERNEPIYKTEKKFGLPRGTLRDYGDFSSSMNVTSNDEDNEPSETCDTIRYFEVYSRIGLGAHLKANNVDSDFDELQHDVLDAFGDNVYLAIPATGGYPYPLNVPPELFQPPGEAESEEAAAKNLADIQARVSWPIPAFHDRSNPWPCAVLGFHQRPKSPWCHSHMTPAMGIQKAMDWIMSFLIGRVHITSRAIIVVPKGLPEEIKQTILYGGDLELAEIEAKHPGTRDMLCEFLKMPEVNGEIWELWMALRQLHEDATGVTELNMAGRTSTQMRSAQEAVLKRDILSVRPQDMSNTVEDWMAVAARLEAGAAAAILREDDVARAFCEPPPSAIKAAQMELTGGVDPGVPTADCCTTLWTKLISGAPLDQIFGELEFSIESGSAARPNQEEQKAVVDEVAQLLVPSYLQQFAMTGDPTQINAFQTAYFESRNKTNYQAMLFPDMRQQMQMQQMMAAMQQPAAGGGSNGSSGPPNGAPKNRIAGAPQGGGAPPMPQGMPPELMALVGAAGGPPGAMPPMPPTNGAY